MYEGIYKSSDFALFSNANEEIYPNFWLKDMRYANQEKTDDRKFFDCYFHKFLSLNLRTYHALPEQHENYNTENDAITDKNRR